MTICNRPHPKIIKINNSKIILTTKDDSYESKSLRNFFSLYIYSSWPFQSNEKIYFSQS